VKEKISQKYDKNNNKQGDENPSISQNERIFLFMKGADNILIERAHPHQRYIDLDTLVSQTKVTASFIIPSLSSLCFTHLVPTNTIW
jgi:hypothetical protein